MDQLVDSNLTDMHGTNNTVERSSCLGEKKIAASFENHFKSICLTLHVVEYEVTAEFKGLRKLLPLLHVAPLRFPSSV